MTWLPVKPQGDLTYFSYVFSFFDTPFFIQLHINICATTREEKWKQDFCSSYRNECWKIYPQFYSVNNPLCNTTQNTLSYIIVFVDLGLVLDYIYKKNINVFVY